MIRDRMRSRPSRPSGSNSPRIKGQLWLAMAHRRPESSHASAGTHGVRRSFRVAGLFAGIGGIELGLTAAGHETALLCENDPGAIEVLKSRFPSVPNHDDVRTLEALPPDVDLLTAGFPCQDLSQAGMTQGISGARSGLVGEVFRLLEQRRTSWVLLENVSFMLQLAKGRALSVIIDGFERLGYRWAYRVVDTRAFGLPQRRERVFFLASLDEDPRDVLLVDETGNPPNPPFTRELAFGFYWTEGVRGLGAAVNSVPTLKGGSTIGIPSPPAILMPDGAVVTPELRDAERLQGFPADWTKPANHTTKPGHRWKLVGNAVTADVATWIGERLANPGRYDDSWDPPLPPDCPWPRAAWNVGSGRHSASTTSWPFQRQLPKLHEYLQYAPAPLSAKATAGFLARTAKGYLRFPEGFLGALENHLARMQSRAAKPIDGGSTAQGESRDTSASGVPAEASE